MEIQVFACRSSSSDRILKLCAELKMTFLQKPLTKEKLELALAKYLE